MPDPGSFISRDESVAFVKLTVFVSRSRILNRIRTLDASLHFANGMSKYAKLTGGEPNMQAHVFCEPLM